MVKSILLKMLKLFFYVFFSVIYINALDFICIRLDIDNLGIQLFLIMIVIILAIITSERLLRNDNKRIG